MCRDQSRNLTCAIMKCANSIFFLAEISGRDGRSWLFRRVHRRIRWPWRDGRIAGTMPPVPRLQQLRHQSRPTRLMRCPDASPRIAMKIFMEQDVILEMRISRELGMIFQHWPLAISAFEK